MVTNAWGDVNSNSATLTVNYPELTLVAQDTCVNASEQLVVNIDLSSYDESCPDILGGQFLLEYDETVLDFVSAEVGGGLIVEEIYEIVDEPNGLIDYAVGTDTTSPEPGITSGTMAILTFDAIGEVCDVADLITFRANDPPTRLTNENGDYYDEPSGNLLVLDLGAISIDWTDPVISCPADLDLLGDPDCNDTDPGYATATDTCDTSVDLTWVRSDGQGLNDPFCIVDSPITIEWTATDDCGNTDVCTQTITVRALELQVNVQLAGSFTGLTFDRCITFELWECATPTTLIVEEVLTFTDGLASATFTLAPQPVVYECITARDTLHTLMKEDADDFAFDALNQRYTADFTDQSPTGDDDSLLGGNVNDDSYIDIIDFGLWAINYGTDYGTADTDCSTASPHPDFSGDGVVNENDFSFVQINFFLWDEAACCGLKAAAGNGPVDSISVKRLHKLGYGELAVMDLNHDGWYDMTDIQLWLKGVRPRQGTQTGGTKTTGL